jgi:hypothetical protein
MPTKRYKPEQIMTLRQVEVVIANGKLTPHAAGKLVSQPGVEQTLYATCSTSPRRSPGRANGRSPRGS